jgi:hypothetical protein
MFGRDQYRYQVIHNTKRLILINYLDFKPQC